MSRRVTVDITPYALPLVKEAPMQSRSLSRQERVDCAAFLVILAALLLYACSLLFTPTAAAQSQAPAAISETVDIATDSESEPSGIAGLTVGELMRDAWTSQATLPDSAPLPAPLTLVPEYVASYEGSVPEYPGSYYSVPSTEFPGVTHVFQSVVATKA